MTTRKEIACVPGRVCLAGEFLDWMTGPSTMCAVNLRITAEVSFLDLGREEIEIYTGAPYALAQTIPFHQLGIYQSHVLDFVHASYKVLRDYCSETLPVQIRISSHLPAEGGLSSSAAVTLATISALAKLFGANLSNEDLCQLAYRVESVELITGAGQMDYYSCSQGNMMYINCSTVPPYPIELYKPSGDVKIIVVDTLTPRKARDVMLKKHKEYDSRHESIVTYIEKAENAVNSMRNKMRAEIQQWDQIGEIMTECHYLNKRYLEISTSLLDECVTVANQNGALGSKMTGAGTGGCMFSVVYPDDALRVIEKMQILPVRVYLTEPALDGIITRSK